MKVEYTRKQLRLAAVSASRIECGHTLIVARILRFPEYHH